MTAILFCAEIVSRRPAAVGQSSFVDTTFYSIFGFWSAFGPVCSIPGGVFGIFHSLNPLTPNDPHRGRTAPLTSKRCILYIYSTNIGTGYFKQGIYSPLAASVV